MCKLYCRLASLPQTCPLFSMIDMIYAFRSDPCPYGPVTVLGRRLFQGRGFIRKDRLYNDATGFVL